MRLEDIISVANENDASYVFITCNDLPRYKKDCSIEIIDNTTITRDDCFLFAKQIIGKMFHAYERKGHYECIVMIEGIRCRVNITRQEEIPSLTFLLIQDTLPEIEALNLPDYIRSVTSKKSGLFLVAGGPSSGKTSTIIALTNYINQTEKRHIITYEDQIEYPIISNQSVVNQRILEKDPQYLFEAFYNCLRENPDVVVFDGLETRETVDVAIRAAEAGLLVFASCYTSNISVTAENLVQLFPKEEQGQIRMRLSMVLEAILAQKLIPQISTGRVLAYELLVVTDAIRVQIKEGLTSHLKSALVSTTREGSISFDDVLIGLIGKGKITLETAILYSTDRDYISRKIGFNRLS